MSTKNSKTLSHVMEIYYNTHSPEDQTVVSVLGYILSLLILVLLMLTSATLTENSIKRKLMTFHYLDISQIKSPLCSKTLCIVSSSEQFLVLSFVCNFTKWLLHKIKGCQARAI